MDQSDAPVSGGPSADGEAMAQLWARFQECIEAAGQLEAQRDGLVRELAELQEPMLQAVWGLREELLAAHQQKARAEVECQSLREDTRLVKRRLFAAARACVQCQYTLEKQRHDVAQLSVSQEELQARLLQLSQELPQLEAAHQDQLAALRDKWSSSGRARDHCDLSECRRASLDLERYLKDERRSLEGFYEPQLLALLKRQQASAEALRRTREQAAGLRQRLWPLQEEVQRLIMQRTSLEERTALMRSRRSEDVLQYRETMEILEDSIRELKTEVHLQKQRNEAIESLRNSLSKELADYKDHIEGCAELLTKKPDET
ncbi:syncoilin [Lepisosteus oculatus]|uniref:syncoilin n=1 Tax=Lepisosteus oculatus TaxID=7918 RepID=UPI0035F50E57